MSVVRLPSSQGSAITEEAWLPPHDLGPDSGTPPLPPPQPGVAGGFLLSLVPELPHWLLSLSCLCHLCSNFSALSPLCLKYTKYFLLSYWERDWSIKIRND